MEPDWLMQMGKNGDGLKDPVELPQSKDSENFDNHNWGEDLVVG